MILSVVSVNLASYEQQQKHYSYSCMILYWVYMYYEVIRVRTFLNGQILNTILRHLFGD